MRRNVWLMASGLLVGAAMTITLLTGFQDDGLGYINDMPLDRREFMLFVSQERAQTAQYFKNKYSAEVNESFWTTIYDGIMPADYAKQAALDRLIDYKLQQRLAISYGLEVPADFGQFLQRLQQENKRRNAALQNGSPIYGPTQYDEWGYYDYVHSNMLIGLKSKMLGTELKVTEDEVRDAYEQWKDERYRVPDHAALNVMSFSLTDTNRVVEAMSNLTNGVSFRKVRSELSPYLLKHVLDGENITLGESGTEDASETEERLLEAAMKLENGEATRVQFADYISVVQLIGKSELRYAPYDEVKEAVRSELIDQKFKHQMVQMKKQAKAQLNQRKFRSVKLDE
jgi:hypothetical protein